jgi:hypothetical protein
MSTFGKMSGQLTVAVKPQGSSVKPSRPFFPSEAIRLNQDAGVSLFGLTYTDARYLNAVP